MIVPIKVPLVAAAAGKAVTEPTANVIAAPGSALITRDFMVPPRLLGRQRFSAGEAEAKKSVSSWVTRAASS
ncbi:MAG: hypothetical protein JOZ81_14730 [Chloroflexi bacterium]|nr:hypothetical protein [Chloroflexota bacterium]